MTKSHLKIFKNRGFTLLEVVIYTALFSLLLGIAFVATYQIIDSSGNLNLKITIEEEGNFVMRKINWVFTGLDPNSTPTITGSGCAQKLSVKKTDSSINPVILRLNNISGKNYIEIKENGGSFNPITTANVNPSCLKFSLLGGSLSGVVATFTLNDTDFSTVKYIRK